MRVQKLAYEPARVADFFAEGLQTLGAVCERTWHDRLEVLAEGEAARLWREGRELVETELRFRESGDTRGKDAGRDVFPGAPLTFRLAEALWGGGRVLEKAAVRFPEHLKAPGAETAERLWQAQFPGQGRWEQKAPFAAAWCFSLLAVIRCEIQATDQSWSLHRLAIQVPGGGSDDKLAASLEFAEEAKAPADLAWPRLELSQSSAAIGEALQAELQGELRAVRERQQAYLRRELNRIDDYFAKYSRELASRGRSGKDAAQKLQDRLAATGQEHERRREDQVHRHEIRVTPHVDTLMLVAEPCWTASLQVTLNRAPRLVRASFVPRARAWRDVTG